VETLGITSRDGGVRWQTDDEVVVLASETWSEISAGRESHGPSGNRLRITTEALDQLLGHLDVALIIVVRVRREDRRARYADLSENDDEGGENDRGNDFRVFSYQPGTGWSDSSGRIGTRYAAGV